MLKNSVRLFKSHFPFLMKCLLMVLMSVMKFVSLVQSYHLFCTRAILKNGDRKGKRLTIYLKIESLMKSALCEVLF